MKIITWNDCCKFREKFSLLVPFDADIMVIEECEDPQRASSDSYSAFESNALGIGHNKNKGVGVFAKPRIKIEKLAWDRLHDQRNQTTVTRLLQERGLVSAYHYVTGEAQGQERTATFYMYRNRTKPHHIDYCFCSEARLKQMTVLNPNQFLAYSDHVPITIVID